MKISLLLVRFATVLRFSMWACWYKHVYNQCIQWHTCIYWYIQVYTGIYLWGLTQTIIWIAPQHYLPDLMENAVGLLKIPLGLFTSLVRQVLLQNVKEINSLLVQFGKVWQGNTGLACGNVPVHALNEYLNHLVTGIRNVGQAVETWTGLGPVDCCVDEFNLVYTSIFFNKHSIT